MMPFKKKLLNKITLCEGLIMPKIYIERIVIYYNKVL